jgi:hypothetical protein
MPLILALLSIGMAGYKIFEDIRERSWADPSSQMVPVWDKRIQPLRQFLPAEVKIAGYLDSSMVAVQADPPLPFDSDEFFLMQYSMAPIVLDMGIEQSWIVGNFNNDTDFVPWLDKHLGNYEIQYFGYSLYLIHRLGK